MRGRSVLFDGYWLVDGPPSGRNVVASLIRGWSNAFPHDRVVVALPREPAKWQPLRGVQCVVVGRLAINHAVWTTLSLRSAVRELDVDGIVSQNFAASRLPPEVQSAVFLHDAIVFDRPEWFTLPERIYLQFSARSLRRATQVLTSSHSEAARISRVLPRLASRVFPIGLSVPFTLSESTAHRPSSVADSDMPFVLAVGRLNVRKNLRSLIEAFLASSLHEKVRLLIVGSADGMSDDASANASDAVKFLGHTTDPELRWLYENCALFVFPSLDEGFGLPLLEARHFGAKAAVSDIPSFREISEADEYFDPRDISSMIASIEGAYTSPGRSRRQQATEEEWRVIAARARRSMFGEATV